MPNTQGTRPVSTTLKDYLNTVAKLPRLTPADVAALLERHKKGEFAATRALTEAHLAYVVAQAGARRGQGPRFEQLIAAGNRGLMEALRRTEGPFSARLEREVERHLALAVRGQAKT